MTDLTRKGASDLVQWTEQCQESLERVKQALCGEPLLHTPNFSLPFVLQTDVSGRGLGAVLSQQVRGVDRPVLYISRKLSEREARYSTVERECLAIRWAVDALEFMITHAKEVLQHRESSDPKVSHAGIVVRTGRKWRAREAVTLASQHAGRPSGIRTSRAR